MLLARVRSEDVASDEARQNVRQLYSHLTYEIVNDHLPQFKLEVRTSMFKYNPKGVWTGMAPDLRVPVVVTDIARGGMLPSETCINELSRLGFQPRHDVILMNRTTDSSGHVNGVAVQGCKTGDSVKGAIVIYPDCMLATGGSVIKAIEINEKMTGPARCHIVIALICTRQGAENIWTKYPDTLIYTVNVDPELDEHDYILPGAGDMGNKLNGPSDLIITGLEQQTT